MKFRINKKICGVLLIAIIAFATCIINISNLNITYAQALTADNGIHEIYYSDDYTYSDEGSSYTVTEVINYATKTTTSYIINNSFPSYYNTDTSLTNTCANVAGSNIIGFYDRFYINLIPDYTPGILRANGYTYYAMNVDQSKKQGVINALYTSMSTNNPVAGTSQAQYNTGLASYITGKSLSINYNSVMSDSAFSLSMADTQFRNGNPISLFLSGYNFSSINDNGSSATLTKVIYSGNHIVIAYGYQQVNYYNSNGILIKSNLYLYISTGIQATLQTYIVNNNGTLNDAEAAHIY